MLRLLRVVASLIQSALDVILPRKERTVRIDRYNVEHLPVAPLESEMHGIQITSLMSYREKAVEDCIRALKYDKSARAAALCADVLAEYLREEIAAIRSFSTHSVVLIPVPLHTTRLYERGFNQIELVLEHLPPEFRNGVLARVAPNALVRVRETPPQTHLTRDERLTNVEGAFALDSMDAIMDAHVFLLDDVTTTGATLAAASRPLTSLGIPVNPLALARA